MKRALKWAVAGLLLLVIAAVARHPFAETLVDQAADARREWRLEAARTRLEWATRIAPDLLPARLKLAQVLATQGQVSAERRVLDPLLAAAADDRELYGRVVVAAAGNLYRSNEAEAAWTRYQEALEVADETGDPKLRVRALIGSAAWLFAWRGELDEGRQRLEEALELARQIGNEGLEADALCALGIYYWWYDHQPDRPLDEFFEPAREIYRRLDDRRGLAEVSKRVSAVYIWRDDFKAATRELDASLELFRQIGDAVGLAQAHRYLGVLYVNLDNHSRAHDHYRRSLDLCEASGYRLGMPKVEGHMALLRLHRREYEPAIETLERLIDRGRSGGVPLWTARNHLMHHGNALIHLGRPEEARISYERALELDRRLPGSSQETQAKALILLAHAHMQSGDLDLAADTLAEVEAIPLADKGWQGAVMQRLARADLMDYHGRKRDALAHLLAAAQIENQTFGAARSHFYQTHYRQAFERLCSLLLEGVLVKDDAERLVFRFLEQMRYRSFRSVVVRLADRPPGPRVPDPEEAAAVERIERLSRSANGTGDLRRAYAEYEDLVLRSELTAPRYDLVAGARPVELAELQARLEPGTALVEYVLAGERTFALIVTRRTVDSAVLPAAASNLEAKVKLFRHLVFEDASEDSWKEMADELGRLVIDPLTATGAFDGIRQLVIVPMGFFHDLPFAALLHDVDGDRRLLMEHYAIARAPSATLWSRLSSRASRNHQVSAFGLRQSRAPGLPSLEFAEVEAESVATVLGGEARVGREATESALKSSASSARVLHIATHGVGEPRIPLHSYLALAPGGGDDGDLTVREILDLGLDAELVALSACGTGLARTSSGAGLEVDRIGFVEAFLYAGAGNVLATLLPVSDRATSRFMDAFYRHLRATGASAALAAAQREMLGEAGHPRYWAPFVLVGPGAPTAAW